MTEEQTAIPHIQMIEGNQKRRVFKFPIFNLLLTLLATFLLMVSTFVQIPIPHIVIPFDAFSNPNLAIKDFIYTYILIPQIPVLFFILGALGKKLTLTSILLYLLIGLFILPIFALGGGIGYVTEFSFGYLLAYLPAIFVASCFIEEKFSFLNALKAVVVGVLIIHLSGIIYMMIVALIKQEGIEFIKGWILSQSFVKFIYDFIISLILLYVAQPFSKFLDYLNNK